MAIYSFDLSFPEALLDWEAGVGLDSSPSQPPSSTVTLGKSPLQASLLTSVDQSRRDLPGLESPRTPLM